MLNQVKELSKNLGEEYLRKQQVIDGLIKEHVDKPEQYVFGLAQVESPRKDIVSLIIRLAFKRIRFHNEDYIIGADEVNNALLILELDENEQVGRKTTFESGSLCIKKHSRIVSELLNKRDRYGREKFDFSNGEDEYILLVGKKSVGESKFFYDNTNLMKTLSKIRKNII
ncbi:hypothetical protein HB790_01750 [Listeria welshimeri]|uniref:Uncharacterized protein n=1 Tax=Listeria welshimeri TaxID=1643 RepID=A0ABX4IHG3_LISWE|nr:hypothetical protein [Listeria welshimeri]MBC1251455.1 hypothetical protein [Listeria welshimeri]MBC1450871.1 hypothetical protein [Listeria welshimeri]MBC1465314.1 hypothetical protein [Listeria welshimeri]MBC1601280.1 hypothetical protein [Listeria welshimeri]MBC1676817.1 hypothetical protein [Listeria welshimeri]